MKFHPCNHSNEVHGSIFSILRPDKTQLTSLNSYPAKAPSPVRTVGVSASRCPEERLSRGAPRLEQRLANVGHQFTGHPTLSATRVDAFLVPPSNKPSIFQPITLPFTLNHRSSISCDLPSR
jgi:hypothetical protein